MATKIYQCMQKISDAIVENQRLFNMTLTERSVTQTTVLTWQEVFTEVMKQLPEE